MLLSFGASRPCTLLSIHLLRGSGVEIRLRCPVLDLLSGLSLPGRDRSSSSRDQGRHAWIATMSNSSTSELGKERNGYADKEVAEPHLTEAQEDLIEAGDPPFTEKDDEEVAGDADGDADGALSRVSSRPSVNNIKSVPNGGLRAWLQVLSSFFVFFNTWGIINAVCLPYHCHHM